MPSVWSWLPKRDREDEQSIKPSRLQQHHRNGEAYMESINRHGNGYIGTKVPDYKSHHNNKFLTSQPDVGYYGNGYTPKSPRVVYASHRNDNGWYTNQENAHNSRQIVVQQRPQSYRTYQKPSMDFYQPEYRSEPRPVYYSGYQGGPPNPPHYQDPYFNGRAGYRAFPQDNSYRYRLPENTRLDNLTRYGTRTSAAQQLLRKQNDYYYSTEWGQQQHQFLNEPAVYFSRPVRNNFSGVMYTTPRPNEIYIPRDNFLNKKKTTTSGVEQGYVKRHYMGGNDAISSYVPRIMGQKDVSAILMGKPEQNQTFFGSDNSRAYYPSTNREQHSRNLEDGSDIRDTSLHRDQSAFKEGISVYPLKDKVINLNKLDNGISLYSPDPRSTDYPSHVGSGYGQAQQPRFSGHGSDAGKGFDNIFDSNDSVFRRPLTSKADSTSSRSNLAAAKEYGGYNKSSVGVREERSSNSQSDGSHFGGSLQISSKLKKIIESGAAGVSDNMMMRRSGEVEERSKDEVDDEEVWNVLSHFDDITNIEAEATVHRQLDVMFGEGENEVFY